MDNRDQYESRSWLQRVQEQSWEPEILISGIVLFALFQIPPYIRQAAEYLDLNSIAIFSNASVDESLAAILLTGNYWLIAGFTTHLIGRSIWAAFIGLSYVYGDGIQIDKLKYHRRYKAVIARNSDYKTMIMKLEAFCSRIFAISFLLFMCILGVSFFTMVLGLFIGITLELAPELSRYDRYIDPVIQIVGLIYFIDFVTVGMMKRIPGVNKIYYPFYRVMSFLTLAPLYRNIYYGIVTNHKAWKVGVGMLIFGAVSLLMAVNVNNGKSFLNVMQLDIDSGEDYLFPGNYYNLAGDRPSKRMLIESDVIEKNVAKIFLVHSTEFEDEHILKGCNYSEHSNVEDINLDSLKLSCIKEFMTLTLNGDTLSPYYYYTEDRAINRSGLAAYIDLGHLNRGMHEFRLYYRMISENDSVWHMMVADVEFYKSVGSDLQTKTDTIE